MSKEIKVAIVVAVAENGVIGRNNALPWRLPKDLAYFKRVTYGHPVVMGRKTFESIGRPLPGRTNIVVSRNKDWMAEGVVLVHSLENALQKATEIASADNVEQVMVIGGAEFYRQTLPIAGRLYFTEVHAAVDGDAFFPDFDRSLWQVEVTERYEADAKNPYAYSFVVMDRKGWH